MEQIHTGKVAFITGAGAGIGLSAAQAFARLGAAVVLADSNDKSATKEADSLVAQGFKVMAVRCDVSNENEVRDAVQKGVSEFGRIDFAFNNAGVHVPVAETADVLTEDFDRIMSINLRGVFFSMKYELQQMRVQGSGVIVNCSSQSGILGLPGLAAYTASKHGVIGLTKAAALEYAQKGIRINAICPGTTETPLVTGLMQKEPGRLDHVIKDIPLGRMGKPEEIADAVLWLCSPLASFVIGQSIIVDGGYSIR